MQRRILLDLDGVLADFFGHGIRMFAPGATISPGSSWLPDILGITEPEFWEKVSQNSKGFWYEMPLLPDAMEIYNLAVNAVGTRNVGICSSPSRSSDAAFWKQKWVEHHFPALARQVIITPAKYLCGSPGILLVDDWEKNAGFADPMYGGSFFLIPRLWNQRHEHADKAVMMFRHYLKAWV